MSYVKEYSNASTGYRCGRRLGYVYWSFKRDVEWLEDEDRRQETAAARTIIVLRQWSVHGEKINVPQ